MIKSGHTSIVRLAVFAAGFMMLLSSCTIERKLASEYLKNRDSEAVLLIRPDFIYKEGYKVPDSINVESIPEAERSAKLLGYTELIQYLDDSIFIEGYMNGLVFGLRQAQYQVFSGQSAHSFLLSSSDRIILNLAQLEIEEYYIPVEEQASFSDEENYSYEFDITGVNINSWFEISGMNRNDTSIRVVYNNYQVSDHVASEYRYFAISGEVKFLYHVDSLQVYDLYEAGWNAGYYNADNFSNYLLNRYIRDNMPKGKTPGRIFTLERETGMLRKARQQGFIEMQ